MGTRACMVCAGLALCLTAATVRAQEARKPVALVGASYGRYEVRSVIKNVLSASKDNQVIYESKGDQMPAGDLSKYSLVIIAHSMAKPLTAEENAAFAKYVEGGGHVLLISSAPRLMASKIRFPAMTWPGLKRVAWHRKGRPCAVLKPDHPMLKGVFDAKAKPSWLTGSVLGFMGAPGYENVIGTKAGDVLFGIRPLGKGWTAYLGHELFRLRSAKSAHRADSPSYIKLIANIVAASGALTQAEQHDRAVKQTGQAGGKVLVWDREWQFGESYGPRFSPPLPAEKERVTSLAADMAIDEYEALQLNITPMEDLGNVTWRIDEGGLPEGSVQFFVQDRPEPIPWKKDPAIAKEFPFWLLPPKYVAPKGSDAFTAPKQVTRILWIKIGSFGAKPGTYSAKLSLSFAKGHRVEVPIQVKIYPVRLPRKRLITLAPGGTVYADANNAGPGEPFARNLESNGFEWGVINIFRPYTFGIVGTKDKLTVARLAKNKARFENGDPPRIDFRALDGFVEQQIRHNLTKFRTGQVSRYLPAMLKKAGYDEALAHRAEQWYLREAARYLKEKGARDIVARLGDELSEKELLERWLPWAKRMTEAGWGCGSTFTGLYNHKPELNRELFPYVKVWTLNRGIAVDFTAKLKTGELKKRPDAIVGTYGAGSGMGIEFRKPLSASRFLGWESWMLGIEECYPNPYFKGWLYYVDYRTRDAGVGGERFVSYIDRGNLDVPLANSPFLEGIREGLEDGNLCAILSWTLDRMEKAGGASAARARTVRAKLDTVLGSAEGSTVRWREQVHGAGYKIRRILAGQTEYRRGKREVLELLASIRGDAQRVVAPSVYWNDVPLVTAGKPVAVVYAGGPAGMAIAREVADLCGTPLPMIRNTRALSDDVSTSVIVGNGKQNALAASVLKHHGARDADAQYPGPGGYLIKELKRPDGKPGTVLIVAGADEAGTEKGVAMFNRFLRAEGAWLTK